MPKYCIIGAGAAGLGTLKVMSDQGFEVDCFERTGQLGGHWNTDYDALHLITPRSLSRFDEMPMPEHYPNYPSKDQVAAYLNGFADEFGLRERVTFNTEVVDVRPTNGDRGLGGWTVTFADGTERHYDGVLVANGHLWNPVVPEFAAQYEGKQLHSHDYQNTADIEGDRVLVVGTGNSGCDLAVDAAQHRIRTSIAVRRGHYYLPKTFFGKPPSELEFLAKLSPSEGDLARRLLAKVAVGTPAEYGLPMPEHETLAENAPIVNDLLLYWIQHGRVEVRPGIERFEGKNVHFTDGTVEEYSTVLWATGFSARVPFLQDGLVQESKGVPLRVGAGIVPVGLEKLFFIGLIAPRGAQFPVYQAQARVAADMIRLHESGSHPEGVAELLAHQEPEDRIDVLRHEWMEELDETARAVAEAATLVGQKGYEHA